MHEFQADAFAAKNKERYIDILMNNTFDTNRFAIAHTFFYHPLKRRIMMLQKPPLKSGKMRITIMNTSVLVMTLLLGIIYLQSCKQPPRPEAENAQFEFVSVPDTASITVTQERTDLPKPFVSKEKVDIPNKNGRLDVGNNSNSNTSLNADNKGEINLVPTSTRGIFIIKGTTGKAEDETISIEITDLSGKVVFKETVNAIKGLLDEKVSLKNGISGGMYVVNVRSVTFNMALHMALSKL